MEKTVNGVIRRELQAASIPLMRARPAERRAYPLKATMIGVLRFREFGQVVVCVRMPKSWKVFSSLLIPLSAFTTSEREAIGFHSRDARQPDGRRLPSIVEVSNDFALLSMSGYLRERYYQLESGEELTPERLTELLAIEPAWVTL